MLFDIFLHFCIGLLGLSTGWAVRSACKHTGLIPHWRWQVPLALALVLMEACITVPLIG